MHIASPCLLAVVLCAGIAPWRLGADEKDKGVPAPPPAKARRPGIADVKVVTSGPDEARRPGFAGIKVAPIEPEDRADYGLKPDQDGVVILDVVKDGPAEKAGLTAGDIICTVNTKACDSPEALTKEIRALAPGDQATFAILRDEKPLTVTMKVGAAPANTAQAPSDADEGDMRKQQEAMLAQLPPEMRAKIQEIQKLAETKMRPLVEKYMADGLSREEAQQQAQEDVMADPEFQKLQEELQGLSGR